MVKRWVYQPLPDENDVKTLSTAINVNPILSTVLVQRGISDFDTARNFFRPTLDMLHDPFLMKDMDKAVERIIRAMDNNEKVLVYGDYDVDGTTSVAMFFGFLKELYPNVAYYIPDRYKEGYGISGQSIEWAKESGISLIISLDCGVKANSLIELAKQKGIDFIVCDHHTPGEELPPAIAVLDPKRSDCAYPFKELSGCGVGFKLIQAIAKNKNIPDQQLFGYLDLVAISIASDIVPIVGENRVLTYHGLQVLNTSPRPGINALIELVGIQNRVDISGIVFGIGPRINAAGRIGHAGTAVELLLSEDEEDIEQLAQKINEKNNTRRDVDSTITKEALAMIEDNEHNGKTKSTVLFKNDWHKGVIGIVASRCIEKYYRPTIILTESEGKATGSARSVAGYNVHDAIASCDDLLDQYGGHMYAAGLTMPVENVEAFQARFEQTVQSSIDDELLIPKITIDTPITLDNISDKFCEILKQMSPFGPQHMEPVFSISNAKIMNNLSLIKEKHLRGIVGQEGCSQQFAMIAFGLGEHYERISTGEKFEMAFIIDENHFRGNKTLQLNVKDIKFAD